MADIDAFDLETDLLRFLDSTLQNAKNVLQNVDNESQVDAERHFEVVDPTVYLIRALHRDEWRPTIGHNHRRRGTFGLRGAVTFLPEKFTQFPNAWLLKSGCKSTQIARKTNSLIIYRVAGTFSWEFNFADFGFFRFCGKKNRKFGFPTLLARGNNISRISCTVFESNKNGSRAYGCFRYTVCNQFHWSSAM